MLIKHANIDRSKPAGDVLSRFGLARSATSIAAATRQLSIWLIEHRKAQVAGHIVATLRHKSDADLARLGIRREQIGDYVKQRLYKTS
jgi:hypothetical protein